MELLTVLLANLDEAYDKKGWHGTTLRGGLRGVSVEQAIWRPTKGAHAIWDYTLHAAYWKHVVHRRLTGDGRGSFPVKGKNYFPVPVEADQDSWRETVAVLDEMHRQLRSAIAALGSRDLADAKKVRMIYGIAAHDLYHAGQIQLLKRLQK